MISSSVFVDGVVIRELSSSRLLVDVSGSCCRYSSMSSWRAPLFLAVVVVGVVVFLDIVGCCLSSASLFVPVGVVRRRYRRCWIFAVVVVCIVLGRCQWWSSLLSSSISSSFYAVCRRCCLSPSVVVVVVIA